MTGEAPDERVATTVEAPAETAPAAADAEPSAGAAAADLDDEQQTPAPAETATAATAGDAESPAVAATGPEPAADEPAADEPAADETAETAADGPVEEHPDLDAAAAAGADASSGETQRQDTVPDLASALEAVLMVVDEPIPVVQLAQVLEVPRVEVEQTLQRLSAEYTEAGRGFDLRAVAGGWRFYSRPECAPIVERFILDGQQARLTQAALETLAVIAYRQPVSRARVSGIRGVNCDGVVRTLVNRGLIEEAGTEQDSNAVLYRTTNYFLERLGLQNLDELPDIAPYLPDVGELDDAEDAAG